MQGKNKTGQIILLFFLLAGLVAAAIYMVGALNKQNARQKQRELRRAAVTGGQEGAATPTDMPVVPTTSGSASARTTAKLDAAGKLNPNLFRVFSLNAPKNPFIQKEEWYADDLANLPGYPELKTNDYFNNESVLLPNVPEILNPQRSWNSLTLQREVTPSTFEMTGSSDDGLATTTIRLDEGIASSEQLIWTPEVGVPLAALTQPGWESRYPKEADIMRGLITVDTANKKLAANADQPGFVEDSSDLFGGLSIPGNAGGAAQQADLLYCTGVNVQGGRSSAIMVYNGKSFIVQPGYVIPTHYQVLEVKSDGVVVSDTETGASRWIPLSAAARVSSVKPPAGGTDGSEGAEGEDSIMSDLESATRKLVDRLLEGTPAEGAVEELPAFIR
jgi:hypothetical protein